MANGKGCKCGAYSSHECGCDADWTPQEVYDLRAKLKEAEENNIRASLMLKEKRDKCDELEQRLSQAEAELEKYAMVCQHPCGHWVSSVMSFCTVCRDENTKKEYRERLSHLMDVAGKLDSALEWMNDYAWDLSKRVKMNALHTVPVFKNAKDCRAEWDGIKEKK